MKKLVVLLLFATCSMIAQTNLMNAGFDTSIGKTKHELRELDKQNIKLSVKILIDNKYEEHDDFTIRIFNKTQDKGGATLTCSGDITLFLYYETDYVIEFGRKGCSTKKIHFNSMHAPYDNWLVITAVSLSSNNNMQIDAGGITYNTIKNTFETYTHY